MLGRMKPPTRLPQAALESLSELAEFLQPFHLHFNRSESRQAAERYLTGLLTEHPHKNCETLAAVVPGTNEQKLQGLLTNTVWDADDLNRQRVQRMAALPTEGDGVLIFADTGFAKQGQSSVGVARAILGNLGQGRELPSHGQLSLCRTYARVARGNAFGSPRYLDQG